MGQNKAMNTEPSVCCLGYGCSTARAGLTPSVGRTHWIEEACLCHAAAHPVIYHQRMA